MSASDLGNKDLLWGCCLAAFWGQFCSCAFKHCPFSCAQTEVNSCPPPQVNILTTPAAHLGTGSTGLECHLPASSRQRGLLPAPGTDTAPSAPEPLHCPQRCFSFPWPHLLQGLLQRGEWNDTVSLHLGQTAQLLAGWCWGQRRQGPQLLPQLDISPDLSNVSWVRSVSSKNKHNSHHWWSTQNHLKGSAGHSGRRKLNCFLSAWSTSWHQPCTAWPLPRVLRGPSGPILREVIQKS